MKDRIRNIIENNQDIAKDKFYLEDYLNIIDLAQTRNEEIKDDEKIYNPNLLLSAINIALKSGYVIGHRTAIREIKSSNEATNKTSNKNVNKRQIRAL